MSETGLDKKIVSGLVVYDRFEAIVSAAVGTLVSIGLFVAAFFMIRKKAGDTVEGTVVKGDVCKPGPHPGNNVCKITVSYKYKGKSYQNTIISDGTRSKGDIVTLNVDPRNPESVTLQTMSVKKYHYIGYALIAAGILLLISVWVYFAAVMRYRSIAAIGGGVDLVGKLAGQM